jgi:Sulfotransferase family/HEAT repeats
METHLRPQWNQMIPRPEDCRALLETLRGADQLELRGALHGGEPLERAMTAVVLAERTASPSVVELASLAADDDPDLAAVAMWALSRMGYPEALDVLRAMLQGERAEIAAALLEGVGWSPITDAWRAMFAIARRQWKCCLELGKPAVPAVVHAISDRRAWVRQQAVRTLGAMGDHAVESVIVDALSDSSPRVRAEAALALVNLGASCADEQVRKLLRDPNSGVRVDAAHALDHLSSSPIEATPPSDTERSTDDPVFVVGAARSGTTLLRLLLTAHPNISIPPEGDFLLDLAPQFRGRRLSPEDRYRFVDRFFGLEKCVEWGLERDALTRRIEALSPTTYGALAAIPYRMYGELKFGGKPRWGDKNPYYVFFLDTVLGLYPRARAVDVVRDGRDVAASVIPLGFGARTAAEAAVAWVRSVRAGEASRERSPDRVRRLKYEELVAAPTCGAELLCDFIQEPFSSAMLEFHRENRRAGLVPEHRLGWHAATREPIRADSVGRWRRELTSVQTLAIELLAGTTLEGLGYDRFFPAPTK